MRAQTPGRIQPTAGVAQIVVFQLENLWVLPLALVARFHDPEILSLVVVVTVIVIVMEPFRCQVLLMVGADGGAAAGPGVGAGVAVGIETCRC